MLKLDGSWRAKNDQKPFSKYLKDKNLQNQTVFELYTDDNKPKYSSNTKDFSNLKKDYETLYAKETTSKAPTTEFLRKIPNRRNYLMNNLIFVRRKYLQMRS